MIGCTDAVGKQLTGLYQCVDVSSYPWGFVDSSLAQTQTRSSRVDPVVQAYLERLHPPENDGDDKI